MVALNAAENWFVGEFSSIAGDAIALVLQIQSCGAARFCLATRRKK
jgi:hypothetical protein